MLVGVTQAETNTGSGKDILQCCLTGQLSSAPESFKVEDLRHECKHFTDVIKKLMRKLKENIKSEVKTRKIIHKYFTILYNTFQGSLFHNIKTV